MSLPSTVGSVNDQQFHPAKRKLGAAALTNKKEENFDQIHALNIKYLKKFCEGGAYEKFKNLPSAVFYLGLHLSLHVNKVLTSRDLVSLRLKKSVS